MFGLGVDSATRTGWALVERTARPERLRMLDHGVLDLSGKRGPAWSLIAGLVDKVRPRIGPDFVVAVELPYLDENVRTLQVLARFCGRFEQELQKAGAEVELVMASQWQRAVLGSFGGTKREHRKKAAAIWARASYGLGLTEDESDAAAMITSVLRRRDFAGQVAAAGGR